AVYDKPGLVRGWRERDQMETNVLMLENLFEPLRAAAPRQDYLRARQVGAAWRRTILRPQVIFGCSLGSHMNVIPALGVYAALLKEAGRPLSFPGGPSWVREAVDADLLARACEWAATSPGCANETFNINNGDVFEWRQVWPAIAETLGMDVGPDEP